MCSAPGHAQFVTLQECPKIDRRCAKDPKLPTPRDVFAINTTRVDESRPTFIHLESFLLYPTPWLRCDVTPGGAVVIFNLSSLYTLMLDYCC